MKSGLSLFAAAVVLLAAQSALSVRTPAPARPEHRGEEWPPMPYLPVEVSARLIENPNHNEGVLQPKALSLANVSPLRTTH